MTTRRIRPVPIVNPMPNTMAARNNSKLAFMFMALARDLLGSGGMKATQIQVWRRVLPILWQMERRIIYFLAGVGGFVVLAIIGYMLARLMR